MATLRLEDCVNDVCPWSGNPVAADSLVRYRGRIVGFCNPGCRDKFGKAVGMFDELIDAAGEGREDGDV